MSWTTPTLSELVTRIMGDIVTRMQDAAASIRHSLPWTLARVIAGVTSDIYGYAAYIADQILPSTATDAYLDQHGATWGIERMSPQSATGYVEIHGPLGAIVPQGLQISRADGTLYEVIAPTKITHLSGSDAWDYIPVQALEAGATGNTDAGTAMTLTSPPPGYAADAYIFGASPSAAAGLSAGSGYVRVHGEIGAVLSAGIHMQTLSGHEVVTTGLTEWQDTGDLLVHVAPVGSPPDDDPGTYIRILSPPVGIDEDAYVSTGGLTGGTDLETDDAYRARILARIQDSPHGGSADDYTVWAQETTGVPVDDVWTFGYPTYSAGEVHVFFTVIPPTAGGSPIPTPDQVTQVQDHIQDVRPVTAAVTVDAPATHAATLTITLHPLPGYSASDVQSDIEAELQSELMSHGISTSPTTIRNSDLHAAINRAAGIDYYTLDAVDGGAGTDDISLAALTLCILGTVTWH